MTVPVRSRQAVAQFFPELLAPDTLRTLANTAIEAAVAAGADFADIRLADRRDFYIGKFSDSPAKLVGSDSGGGLSFELSYGLRVRTGGAWAFVFGSEVTAEELVRSARTAAATTKGLARVVEPAYPMLPAPVATGEWRTPIEIDPFALSPDEHYQIIDAYTDVAKRVPETSCSPRFRWLAETRVFASSEGARLTQHLAGVVPMVWCYGPRKLMINAVSLPVPGLSPQSAGFEIVVGPGRQERIKALAEEVRQLSRYPVAYADVGRYDAIFDGYSVAGIASSTLGPALELGRALGDEADGAGTSIFAPIDDVLGQQLFSPNLNLSVESAMPHLGAAKWDDEGVAMTSFPLIQGGKIVDYCASRVTAGALANWYTKQGNPMTLRGTAFAGVPTQAPVGRARQLTLHTQPDGPTLDAMIQQLGTGLLLRSVHQVQSDQQLATGFMVPDAMLFEVKRGRITRRLRGAAVQLATKKFWKALRTVGNASTVQNHVDTVYSPDGTLWRDVSAPAIHAAGVDVIQNA